MNLSPCRRARVRRRQQAIAFFLNHGVTLATQLLQLCPVQHRDLPAPVFDHANLLQLAGGIGEIRYQRGKIQILDLKVLKAASCSCYQIVLAAFKRVQG